MFLKLQFLYYNNVIFTENNLHALNTDKNRYNRIFSQCKYVRQIGCITTKPILFILIRLLLF